MRGQCIRRHRFKHMVLEDIFTCIVPIIGDFVVVMITHHIARVFTRSTDLIWWQAWFSACLISGADGPLHEAVHFSTIDVCPGIWPAMRTSPVDQVGVMV